MEVTHIRLMKICSRDLESNKLDTMRISRWTKIQELDIGTKRGLLIVPLAITVAAHTRRLIGFL